MADPTYWETMAFNGGSAIGQTGIETKPYTILSQGTSLMAQKVLDDAALIFPEFDGVTNIALPLPSDFANPSIESFLNWHTAHQVQFLKEQSPNWQVGDLRIKTFGTSSNVFDNDSFLLSADGKRVIHINTLQTTDIATLPLADQEHLAELSEFQKLHANILGLWPSEAIYGPYSDTSPAPPTTLAEARARVKELIDSLETEVQGSAIASRRTEEVDASNIRELYANLFLDQIDLFRQRTDNMAIFNPDSIKREVKDIRDRFQRIEKFMNVTQPTDAVITGYQKSANSTDNLASLNRALDVFLRSEARIHSLAKQSEKIVFFGVYGPDGEERPADAPMMVFLLQTQENYRGEAEAEAKSEEMNQLNQIMQAYTRIQALVNATLQTFDPVAFQAAHQNDDKALERLGFLNQIDFMNMSGLSDMDKLVVSMFDSTLAKANDNGFHPLEIEINAIRPTFEITTLGGNPPTVHSQKEWDLFSSSLGQTAKIVSQDSQKRMDEINRISRAKNKNYELASDTLSKMTDILRSIVN